MFWPAGVLIEAGREPARVYSLLTNILTAAIFIASMLFFKELIVCRAIEA